MTRTGDLQQKGGTDPGEAMVFRGIYRKDVTLMHFNRDPAVGHAYTTFDYEKRFMLLSVLMHWTGLTIENEKVFATIPKFNFVGNPKLNQPKLLEITQAEIEYKRLSGWHG